MGWHIGVFFVLLLFRPTDSGPLPPRPVPLPPSGTGRANDVCIEWVVTYFGSQG